MKRNSIWERHIDLLADYADVYSESVAITVVDHNHLILYCNGVFLRLLKLNAVPFGIPFSDFLSPETQEGLSWPSDQKCMRKNLTIKSKTAAYRTICHIFRSEDCFVLFIDRPVLTDDSFIREFDLINRELTSLTRELQKKNAVIMKTNILLQEKEITQDQAARIANIGQWTWHFADNKVVLSDNFFQVWGMIRDEKITTWKPFLSKLGDEDREILSQRMDEAFLLKNPLDCEFRHFHSDGTVHCCRIVGQVDEIDSGSPLRMVGVIQDVTDRKNHEDTIMKLAFYDTLTGLPNRRMFYDRLRLVLVNSRRYAERGAVIFVDIDGFKQVNDTQGHDAGDLVLQQVARHLEASIREGDTVARMGGDEFMLILSKVGSDKAVIDIAKRILESCQMPITLKNETVTVGASIGISFFPVEGDNEEVLIKKADSAMYRAKKRGGNCWEFF